MKRVQWVCKSNQINFLKKKEESDPKVDRKGRDTIARAQEKGVKSENEVDNLVSPLSHPYCTEDAIPPPPLSHLHLTI